MKKKNLFGLFALAVVGILISTIVVSAYRGDYTVKGPYCDEERHELMETAFETGDYDAWYELMTENGRTPRVVEVVTPENFALFAEAHQAAEDGDYERAAEIRAELGLNNGFGPRDGTGRRGGMGQGKGQGQGMQQNNFVDADNDGNCDNIGLGQGRGRR